MAGEIHLEEGEPESSACERSATAEAREHIMQTGRVTYLSFMTFGLYLAVGTGEP